MWVVCGDGQAMGAGGCRRGMDMGRWARRIGVPKDEGWDTGSLRALEDLGTFRGMWATEGRGVWGLGVLLWGSWVAQGVWGDMGDERVCRAWGNWRGWSAALGELVGGVGGAGGWEGGGGLGCWSEAWEVMGMLGGGIEVLEGLLEELWGLAGVCCGVRDATGCCGGAAGGMGVLGAVAMIQGYSGDWGWWGLRWCWGCCRQAGGGWQCCC